MMDVTRQVLEKQVLKETRIKTGQVGGGSDKEQGRSTRMKLRRNLLNVGVLEVKS